MQVEVAAPLGGKSSGLCGLEGCCSIASSAIACSGTARGFFFDCPDVFLRDRLTGTTTRVSLSNAGEEGVGARLGSFDPAISDDARFIAFVSDVPTLVAGDTNGDQDVFVRDRVAGTTERVNVSSAGAEGTPFQSGSPSISADGRFVAFHSENVNLVPDDTNEDLDVFLRDRLAGTTVRLSVASDGSESGFENANLFPALSADGQAAAFQSEGDLVPGYSGENIAVTRGCVSRPPKHRWASQEALPSDITLHGTGSGPGSSPVREN